MHIDMMCTVCVHRSYCSLSPVSRHVQTCMCMYAFVRVCGFADFDQLDKFVTMEKLHGENMVVRRVLRSYRLRVKNIDEFGDSCDDLIKYMLKATMRIDVSVDTRHGVFDIDFPSPEGRQVSYCIYYCTVHDEACKSARNYM